MREFIVPAEYDGKKLNNLILKEFPSLTINNLYKALRKKDIKVNDKRVNSNISVYMGDNIKVFISDEFLFSPDKKEEEHIKSLKLEIIYEDENIVIINKPIGYEVVGKNSITEILGRQLNTKVFPCHRLDRNTSGLNIFAKNKEILSFIEEKFINQEIEKHYIAKVVGLFYSKNKILEAYLFKDSKNSIVYISDKEKPGYVPIKTEYNVIDENKKDNYSILDITLHTGRTHQIRAHLANINHPIIGDGKYGINDINKKFKQKTQLLCSNKLIFKFQDMKNYEKYNYLNNKEFKISKLPF